MPLQIVRNDITKMTCDAIVNAANSSLMGGGGVDGAIHRAAGRGLLTECAALGGCNTGDAKVTAGYALPCKYIIHTVGPRWRGGEHGEEMLLKSCYKKSLELAKTLNCESIAFPLISSGAYRYPKDKAFQVAVAVIQDFLLENEMLIYLVVFDKGSYIIGENRFSDIQSYIDDKYVDSFVINDIRRSYPSDTFEKTANKKQTLFHPLSGRSAKNKAKADMTYASTEPLQYEAELAPMLSRSMSLNDAVKQIDESFSEMLLRKIDEKGITDAQCYKKANIDRKLFSKIRADKHYRPSKTTAIAFAIALELPIDEATDMLKKAGFALSHSNKFDIIIEYFINNSNYNVFEINEALFSFDQPLLGA